MGIVQELRRCVFRWLVNRVVAHPLVPSSQRWRLLRALGLPVRPSTISTGVWFGGRDVHVGAGSGMNIGVVLDCMAPITLGRHVYVGHQAMLLTSTHEPGRDGRAAGRAVGRPITVGDGAWIGARAVVMPGVTIGAGCTIAAGSLVRTDCEPGATYAGVPARLVRSAAAPARTDDATAA